MILYCDGCGREIERETSITIEAGESLLYFCSDACAERGCDLESLEPTGGSSREEPRGFVVSGDD